jgi:hypothetical protein
MKKHHAGRAGGAGKFSPRRDYSTGLSAKVRHETNEDSTGVMGRRGGMTKNDEVGL